MVPNVTSIQPTVAPYGTWSSPLTATLIADQTTLVDILVDPITSTAYHIEARPNEGGRNVIVRSQDGIDMFPRKWDARTGVQEYGGGSAVVYDQIIYFSNYDDGRVYKIDLCSQVGDFCEPVPITPALPNHRFADFAVHPRYTQFLVCILEDHMDDPGPRDIVTRLVAIDTRGDDPSISSLPTFRCITTLVSGADFYSTPRFNDDGTVLAWTQWCHPDMPWEGSQIFVATVDAKYNRLSLQPEIPQKTHLAGETSRVGAVHPIWVNNNTLLFCCDASGYQNPWMSEITIGSNGFCYSMRSYPILSEPINQDFTEPPWRLGDANFAILDAPGGKFLFTAYKDGRSALYIIDIDGKGREIPCPYVYIHCMHSLSPQEVVFIGCKVDQGPTLIKFSLNDVQIPSYTVLGPQVIDRFFETYNIPPSIISHASSISLPVPSSSWNELGTTVPLHINYYPPKNPAYIGPSNASEKPPTIVNVHDGPTNISLKCLDLTVQFFTSRGWAWIDVNYGGSSLYGREYADRLNGKWGIRDVEDCIQAVRQLSSPQYALIDPNRAVIRGSSAGGFTVFSAMCQESNAFAAGTSLYGISDLCKLHESIHKFQSHNIERLLGGTYTANPDLYRVRSPVNFCHNIKAPLLVLQGLLDTIVPPSQAEGIIKGVAAQGKGAHVEYVIFEDEAHGWRRSKNIAVALEKELQFYEKVLMPSKS